LKKFRGFKCNMAPTAIPLKTAPKTGTSPNKKPNKMAKKALKAFLKKIATTNSRTFLFSNVLKYPKNAEITLSPNLGIKIARILPATKINRAAKIYFLTSLRSRRICR